MAFLRINHGGGTKTSVKRCVLLVNTRWGVMSVRTTTFKNEERRKKEEVRKETVPALVDSEDGLHLARHGLRGTATVELLLDVQCKRTPEALTSAVQAVGGHKVVVRALCRDVHNTAWVGAAAVKLDTH